jgi:hypothetical protein
MIMTSLRNPAFGAIASIGALITAQAQGFTPHVSGEADLRSAPAAFAFALALLLTVLSVRCDAGLARGLAGPAWLSCGSVGLCEALRGPVWLCVALCSSARQTTARTLITSYLEDNSRTQHFSAITGSAIVIVIVIVKYI